MSWSYGSWIYNYLCNYLSCKLESHSWQGVLDTTLCDSLSVIFCGYFGFHTNKTESHDIAEICIWSIYMLSWASCSYQDCLDRGMLLTRKLLNQVSYCLSWSHHLESFIVTTMNWSIVTEYVSQMTTEMFQLS